jgi:hypothetical protein
MEYIQGFLHDSFAKNHYYEFNMDFTMVVCDNVRYSTIDNYDKECFDINFSKGDIMCVKFFKANEGSFSEYTYLEGYYNSQGVYVKINQETIMSREFVTYNSEEIGGKLLVDLTNRFNRDKKIDLILE